MVNRMIIAAPIHTPADMLQIPSAERMEPMLRNCAAQDATAEISTQ